MTDLAQQQLMEMFKELSTSASDTNKELRDVTERLIKIETLLELSSDKHKEIDMELAHLKSQLDDAKKEIEENKRQVVGLSAKIAFAGAAISTAIPLARYFFNS